MGTGFTEIDPNIGIQLKNNIPMRRFGEPEEVAAAIVWLSSDQCSFTTGHCLPLDGGQTVA